MPVGGQEREQSPRFVTRTIWYKRVEYPSRDGLAFSLEAELRRALGAAPEWKNRQQLLRSDPREVLVLNETSLIAAGVAGRIMLFEHDAAMEIGQMDEAASVIHTEYVLPGGDGKQICSGTLHFLVRGNHVILVPSRAVKWQMLANFFNDWVGSQLSLFPQGFRIGLADIIPDRARAELARVRRVEISSALTTDVVDQAQGEEADGYLGVLTDAIRKLGSRGTSADARISVRNAVAEHPLHAKLILVRRGKIKEEEDGFLDQVALAVRGQDEVPFVIRYGKRGRLTNSDVSISDQLVLPSKHGHPQFRTTLKRMVEWFDEQLMSGRIPASEE